MLVSRKVYHYHYPREEDGYMNEEGAMGKA